MKCGLNFSWRKSGKNWKMLNTVAKDVEDVSSLVWFRNDLRVSDHTGLTKNTKNSKRLFGIYCFDSKLFIDNKLGFPK